MPRSPRKPDGLIRRLAALAAWCCGFGALSAAALGLSSFMAPDYWLTDNMSFFLWQFLFAGFAGTLLGLAGVVFVRRFQGLYLILIGCGAAAAITLAALTGLRTIENTEPFVTAAPDVRQLKIVSINLEALFLGDPVLEAYLKRIDADVIVFQETIWNLQKWQWQRRGLPVGGTVTGVYPANRHVGDLGGLVVFSRFPIETAASLVIPGVPAPGANVYHNADREILSLGLNVAGARVNLVAVHPDSPRTPPRWLNKRAYFDAMDDIIADLQEAGDGPVIAIGDWNSAPWSARFHRSLSENSLATAYPDGIPQTTRYFYDYRLRWLLGSPVDQIAVSDGIGVVDVSLGPDIGSDHRPLVVTLQLSDQGR